MYFSKYVMYRYSLARLFPTDSETVPKAIQGVSCIYLG